MDYCPVPLGVPVNYSSEPACTKPDPPLSGMQPSLIVVNTPVLLFFLITVAQV